MTGALSSGLSGGLPSGVLTMSTAVAGGGVGLGLLMLFGAAHGHPVNAASGFPSDPRVDERPEGPARRSWRDRTSPRQLALAAIAAVLVLVVTRWIAAAVGMAVLAFYFDRVFGGTRRARQATARLEALAGWTESLRDLVATGIALPEALPAGLISCSPALRPHLQRLTDRLSAREPLEGSLRALGDDLDDGGADLVVAALLLNTRAQGRALEAVLSALAVSLRGELRVRRTIEAERRSSRRAVQIVVVVTLATALGLALGNPAYVQPYRSVTGQLMLTVVVAVFGAGFTWLGRLSALPGTPRLLPQSAAGRQHPADTSGRSGSR